MSEKKIIRYKDKYLGVKKLVDVSPYGDNKCKECCCRGDMCNQLAKDLDIDVGLCPAYSLFYNIKCFSFLFDHPNHPNKALIFTEMINSIFTCYG